MSMKRKLPPNSPRYKAGGFELKEGEGPITGMQSCGEFLEIYKKENTFHILTPGANDPEETNPNAMWTASSVANVGSSNPIVARVFLQGCKLLSGAIFENEIDEDAVIKSLHAIKESILACERTVISIKHELQAVAECVEKEGLEAERGQMINSFPHIENLEERSATFLINAKRALVQIGQLPSHYVSIKSRGANFHKITEQLKEKWGDKAEVVIYLSNISDTIKRIVDLRNYQEHPGQKTTTIQNIKLQPDNTITYPRWWLTGEEPRYLVQDMDEITFILLSLAEALHIHLLMHNLSERYPFIIMQIREEDIDEECPIHFRLTLDSSKMKFSNDDT